MCPNFILCISIPLNIHNIQSTSKSIFMLVKLILQNKKAKWYLAMYNGLLSLLKECPIALASVVVSWRVVLYTSRRRIRFPVRAQVACSIPGLSACGGQPIDDPALSLFLSKNKNALSVKNMCIINK